MARPLRIQFPHGLYHVTARGNARQTLFADDVDRADFLAIAARVVTRYHLVCHAYCLMGNHYHLLLETPDANLSASMRQLNGTYAQRFNWRHQRTGHVTEGRFHATIVDRDIYLHEVCRYIVLNPVRAGLVSHPRQWPWSSYRATAGEAEAPPLLTVDWILSLGQSATRATAARRYTRFVLAGLGQPDHTLEPDRTLLLGDPVAYPDVRRHVERAASRVDIQRDHRRALQPSLEELFHGAVSRGARNATCARAVREFGYSRRAVARFLRLNHRTVSRLLAPHHAGGASPTEAPLSARSHGPSNAPIQT